MKCTKGFKLEALRCGAGYYIGTRDDDGLPNCRISDGYFKDQSMAQEALDSMMFRIRCCAENEFCSNGRGCVLLVQGRG